ncbi:MAG: hypothetical protein AUH31_09170 [Armatimonadetes bacterium 13_1_40CM_64_14]|nr:MAG: hypothetical protein AUH31_09170 [Armatimonadetes bacterium 13_1_40CM_64_14]
MAVQRGRVQVTSRDLEILARVHAARACDSACLVDLFPSAHALWQRLWLLRRARLLTIHHLGSQRGYSLGRRGVAILGLPAEEVRISYSVVARCLLYARARRKMQAEGYLLNGQDQVGRVTVLWVWRDGRRVAVAVSDPDASREQVLALARRLCAFVNPFGPRADQLVIFGPVGAFRRLPKLPSAWDGRIVFRSL